MTSCGDVAVYWYWPPSNFWLCFEKSSIQTAWDAGSVAGFFIWYFVRARLFQTKNIFGFLFCYLFHQSLWIYSDSGWIFGMKFEAGCLYRCFAYKLLHKFQSLLNHMKKNFCDCVCKSIPNQDGDQPPGAPPIILGPRIHHKHQLIHALKKYSKRTKHCLEPACPTETHFLPDHGLAWRKPLVPGKFRTQKMDRIIFEQPATHFQSRFLRQFRTGVRRDPVHSFVGKYSWKLQ